MGKFKFRFASIVRVKEILEKKIQEEIALINKEIDELENQKKIVIEERKTVQKKMIEHPMKVSEYQSAKMYDSLLEKKIILIEKKIEQLQKKRSEKKKELVEKKKEQKVFETLKENQRHAFETEERRTELKGLNEIAIRNFRGNEN